MRKPPARKFSTRLKSIFRRELSVDQDGASGAGLDVLPEQDGAAANDPSRLPTPEKSGSGYDIIKDVLNC